MITSFHVHGFWIHLTWIDGTNAVDQHKEKWVLLRGWVIHEHNPDLRYKISKAITEKKAA